MPSKDCLTCGEEFEVVKSREDDAKFCSRECYHKGQKEGKTSHPDRLVEYEDVECTGCGTIVEKPPSRVKRSERQFCSQDCYLDWSKSHQQKQAGRRQRTRDKEDASCEICGYERFIEMAHIVSSSNGGTYHKYNICFLCPNHHRLLDHREITMDELSEIEGKIRLSICDGYGWKDPEQTDTFFENNNTNLTDE